MKDREKAVERRLYNKVKEAGGIALKLSALHFAGIPDRIILLPGGRVFFVETKTLKKNPSPIQNAVIARLKKIRFPGLSFGLFGRRGRTYKNRTLKNLRTEFILVWSVIGLISLAFWSAIIPAFLC